MTTEQQNAVREAFKSNNTDVKKPAANKGTIALPPANRRNKGRANSTAPPAAVDDDVISSDED